MCTSSNIKLRLYLCLDESIVHIHVNNVYEEILEHVMFRCLFWRKPNTNLTLARFDTSRALNHFHMRVSSHTIMLFYGILRKNSPMINTMCTKLMIAMCASNKRKRKSRRDGFRHSYRHFLRLQKITTVTSLGLLRFLQAGSLGWRGFLTKCY